MNNKASERAEYQRQYYLLNKDRKKANRKKQPRTEATIRAEKKYYEKMKAIKDVEKFFEEREAQRLEVE